MSGLIEIDRISGTLRGAPDRPDRTLPLLDADAWHGQPDAGLRLPVDAEPDVRFATAKLIAIEFPAFHDGRGLSLAVLLRTRCGYTGELRAIGDIRPDLLHYLARCGFDSFELADGVSIDLDDPRLVPHVNYYQASVRDPAPAFRRQARGRAD